MVNTAERRSASKKATTRRAPKAAVAGAAPDNLRAQGQRTRAAIIETARKLLLESGSLEFSLRSVAQGAGVSISNLQYYFPTRQAVLRAVMEPVIDAYLDNVQAAIASGQSARGALDLLVQRGIGEARNTAATMLWWHFLSLAASDADCARLLDEWYETMAAEIGQLIRSTNARLSVADSMVTARLMIALSDGLAMQFGATQRRRDYMRGLDGRYVAMVGGLLDEAAAAAAPATPATPATPPTRQK